MTADAFDRTTADAFGESLLTVLNHGALCLMLSIGHRTGLLDAMRDLPPATSGEIACHAGLEERYVREWLGALTTSRVVEVDPATLRYRLPAEHAAFLTRAAAPDNVAVSAQFLAILGGVEADVVACFRRGGGVPYARSHGFTR